MILAIDETVGIGDSDVRPGIESELANRTHNTGGVIEARGNFCTKVIRLKVKSATRASGSESSVVVSSAVEGVVCGVGVAGGVEVEAAVEATKAFFVKRSHVLDLILVGHVIDEVVGDGRLTFCTTA